MKPRRIATPLEGEHLVAVYPRSAEEMAVAWHRRLNLFTGRSLTAPALEIEQVGRAGRFALRGQAVSPGVIRGLEAGLEADVQSEEVAGVTREVTRHFVSVASGFGIAASGEDVTVPRPLRVNLGDIQVYIPAAASAEPEDAESSGTGEPTRVRVLGDPLREVLRRGEALPPAGILTLRPVVMESIGGILDQDECGPGSTDPCASDPDNYAYEDWQLVDACQLVLYAWPTDWLPLPVRDARWRNRLAYAIFDAERGRASDEPLPWEELGVPIALLGFDTVVAAEREVLWNQGEISWTPLFLDCNAVVRAGGRPKRRSANPATMPNPFLCQARVQQFAEQVASATLAGTPVAELAGHFRYVPPVGILPKTAVEPRTGRDHFFPGVYAVEAAPIPLEQVDVVLEESAGLASFDLDAADEVRVYVPVPQVVYEPALLRVETLDPAFQATIDEFVLRRGRWLTRREDVRAKASALARAISGLALQFLVPDPDALEPEEPTADPVDPADPLLKEAEGSLGTGPGDGGLVAEAITRLKEKLRTGSPLGDGDVAVLNDRGVEGLIEDLQRKLSAADDRIDFGFARVQTDIYRIRQLILGTQAGTRLATSPALANIAQGESARATQESLVEFVKRAKLGAAGDGDAGPASPAGGGPVPPGPVDVTAPGGAVRFTTRNVLTNLLRSGAEASGERFSPGAILAQPAGVMAASLLGGGAAALRAETGFAGPFEEARTIEGLAAESVPSVKNIAASTQDVQEQNAIVGKALNFRTVTVAERLKQPVAAEAKSFSVASKFTVMKELTDSGINVDDIQVPGFLNADGQEERRSFRDIRDHLDEILQDRHDPDPVDGDEAAFFASAVRAVDHTVAALRLVEGRIQAYRAALELARQALAELQQQTGAADARLRIIAEELAEARHDVSVAKALLAEEQARVQEINARRDRTLTEHVEFLVYQRTRLSDLILDVPARTLDPGMVEAPVPVCLSADVPVPAELRAMVDLLREAPVTWFTGVPSLVDRLDRIDLLQQTLGSAKQRAMIPVRVLAESPAGDGTRLGTAVAGVYLAQRQVLANQRLQVARFDLGEVAAGSWTRVRDRAREVLSLGDLVEGGHGRSDVSGLAAGELEQMAKVAACLYQGFGEVLPSIRLEWAERLSQYDAPANLRNLASLPRWGDIEILDRRMLQGLADWLFTKVNPRQPDAVAMINDLVRLCLLLASHAPVDRIIAGHVRRDTPVRKGGRVELAVDLARVRIGMLVHLYTGPDVVARGVVEDLSAGVAAARVLDAVQPGMSLAAGARAEFMEPSMAARGSSVFAAAAGRRV